MRPFATLTLSTMLVLWCGLPASAGTDDDTAAERSPDTEKPRFQGETVVTATRTERDLKNLPLSVTVVQREEIESTPALQLDDVLRAVPGVVIPLGTSTTHHPTTHLVSMRGLGGNRALMLVDGVPLNDPFFGYIPWSIVPSEGLEKVEVVRGGGSSLFGNYSLGGTINVINRARREAGYSLTGFFGDQNTTRASFSASQPINESVVLNADVSYTDTDGFYLHSPPEDRGAIDAPASAQMINTRVGAEFDTRGGWRGSIRALVYQDDTTGTTRLQTQSSEALRLSARISRSTTSGAELAATAFFHDGEFTTNNANPVPGAGRDEEYISNRHVTPARELGLTLQWSQPIAAKVPLLSFGLDLRRASGEDRADLFDPDGTQTARVTGGGTQYVGGLFAQLSLMPTPRFEILASARADHWSNRDGSEVRQPGGVTEYAERSFTELNPRIAMHYDLGGGFGLRGAVYRAFRGPTLDELYRSFSSVTLEVLANPELNPEDLTGGEVGLELMHPRTRVQLNVYHNEVSDLIARSFAGLSNGVLVFDVVNLTEIRSRGLEASFGGVLGQRWSYNLGYTYFDSVITKHRGNSSREGNRVPDVPEYLATVSVVYSTSSGISATLRGRWVGEQYGDDANRILLDAHTVIDASLRWPIGKGFELAVIGENLADEQYIANARGGERLGMPRRVVLGARFVSEGWR